MQREVKGTAQTPSASLWLEVKLPTFLLNKQSKRGSRKRVEVGKGAQDKIKAKSNQRDSNPQSLPPEGSALPLGHGCAIFRAGDGEKCYMNLLLRTTHRSSLLPQQGDRTMGCKGVFCYVCYGEHVGAAGTAAMRRGHASPGFRGAGSSLCDALTVASMQKRGLSSRPLLSPSTTVAKGMQRNASASGGVRPQRSPAKGSCAAEAVAWGMPPAKQSRRLHLALAS